MSRAKGYKRGVLIFIAISVGTFALMFLFGGDSPTRYIPRRVGIAAVETGDTARAFVQEALVRRLETLSNLQPPAAGRWVLASGDVPAEGVIGIAGSDGSWQLTLESGGRLVSTNLPAAGLPGHEEVLQAFVETVAGYLPMRVEEYGFWDSLQRINLWFFALAVGFWLMNVLTDAWLLRVLLRAVDDRMPFLQCLYTVFGNEFLTAITPFQSGGQPLMVYIMHRNNISVGKGILITFFKTAGQIYFFAILAVVAILLWPGLLEASGLTAFWIYGLFFFGYFLTLTVFVFFRPELAKRITMRFFRLLGKFRYFRRKNLGRGLKKSIKEINIFSFFIRHILRTRRLTFLWLFLLTAVSWLFRFLVAVAVIWGLGVFDFSPYQAVFAQCLSNFLSFFAPSPGGSGVFEFTTRQLFAGFLKNVDLLFVFVVLWRVISYYFNVLLGALVVIRVLRIRKETLNEEEAVIEQDLKKTPEEELAGT